jgi:hypothetical protein
MGWSYEYWCHEIRQDSGARSACLYSLPSPLWRTSTSPNRLALAKIASTNICVNRMVGLGAGGRCVTPRVDGGGGRSTFHSYIVVHTRPGGRFVMHHSAPTQYGDFLTSCTTIFISANTVFNGDKLLVLRRRMNLMSVQCDSALYNSLSVSS